MKLSKKTCAFAFALGLSLLLVSNAGAAPMLADSLADYSLVQGQGGWYYGYYMPETGMDFYLMDVGGQDWLGTEAWVVDEETSWAMIMGDSVHAHGPQASRGSEPGTVLSTRRWVSDVEGLTEIEGLLAKRAVSGGDGVEGLIMVDGAAIWQQEIAFDDTNGVGFSLSVPVTVGTVIDFALGPRGDSNYDTSLFGSRISLIGSEDPQAPERSGAIPEPATLSLLGIGGLTLLARRRLKKRH